VGTNYPFRK